MNPFVHPFFDPKSCTYTYVVVDPLSRQCAVIDPVLDYDAEQDCTASNSADALLEFIHSNRLNLAWILETHIHADHVSAASYLRDHAPGAKAAISQGITQVCAHLGRKSFGTKPFHSKKRHTEQFDALLVDGQDLVLGNMTGTAIATPGHTPSCMTYLFGDCAFVGDTLFMPDYGTARCDFPGGNANELYQSIQRIFTLPEATQLYMCHDYAPGGRAYRYCTTVGEEQRNNIHVNGAVTKSEFVHWREERDATLAPPKLMAAALQHNLAQ